MAVRSFPVPRDVPNGMRERPRTPPPKRWIEDRCRWRSAGLLVIGGGATAVAHIRGNVPLVCAEVPHMCGKSRRTPEACARERGLPPTCARSPRASAGVSRACPRSLRHVRHARARVRGRPARGRGLAAVAGRTRACTGMSRPRARSLRGCAGRAPAGALGTGLAVRWFRIESALRTRSQNPPASSPWQVR